MNTETIPPHWDDLVEYSSELATVEAFILAETWLPPPLKCSHGF